MQQIPSKKKKKLHINTMNVLEEFTKKKKNYEELQPFQMTLPLLLKIYSVATKCGIHYPVK